MLWERASQVTKSWWEQGHNEKCVQILVSIHQGKRSIGRPRHALEDNIRMDHQEVMLWMWTGCMWCRRVYSEHCSESSTKWRELLDELSYYQMLNAVDFLKLGYQTASLPRVRHLSRPKSFHLDGFIKFVEILGFFECLLFFLKLLNILMVLK